VPKSFMEAFEEWKRDDRYKVGEDIGWEYSDVKEVSPTLTESSSTPDENGDENPAQKIIHPRA
jgi:hypothetical protein